MADYIVTSGELTSVANAIREKNGTSSSLSWPNGFVSGIGSGGGGSSDFSTAEVTVVGETQSVIDWALRNSYFPYVANDELLITSNVKMGTYSAVLYKNSLTLIPYFPPTVEGDASVVKEGKDVYVVITGNCTITVPEIA